MTYPQLPPAPYAPHEDPRPSPGAGAGLWAAIVVIVSFVVASVVYLGLTTSQQPTLTMEERQQREGVQTPGEAPDDPNAATLVKVPTFALWAPGTKIQTVDHYPQPGESFTAQSCTVAFSFSGADGRNYAVTAGHCGKEGDLVWPPSAETAADYAVEAGRFIYSGLYSEGNDGVDVGIIEITDPNRYMDLVGDPIPTAIYGGTLAPNDPICKTGGTTGYTCGVFDASGRVQLIRTETDIERETYGDIGNLCASPGDSGGPVFHEINGRATVIGVVSGTEAGRADEPCDLPDSHTKLMSYSNYEQVMGVINRVVPDAQFEEQNW